MSHFFVSMPATAVALKEAARRGVENFSVFSVHKTMPGALRSLLGSGQVQIDGLLLPGHVTTIIGPEAFDFIPREFHLPCAVTGFEPLDILQGISALLEMRRGGVFRVENAYRRAVPPSANPRARALLAEVFDPVDARWRGLGIIPGSGAGLREEFSRYDARRRFAEVVAAVPPAPPSSCRCGEVLRGALSPQDCPLFTTACSPPHPVGPCMVSSEGACAAAYRYERG